MFEPLRSDLVCIAIIPDGIDDGKIHVGNAILIVQSPNPVGGEGKDAREYNDDETSDDYENVFHFIFGGVTDGL